MSHIDIGKEERELDVQPQTEPVPERKPAETPVEVPGEPVPA